MLRLIAGLALCLALPALAFSTTIRVPEDTASIPAAIGLAGEGDTVLVAPGTYHGRCLIQFKNIVLRGAMGAAATTLDGQSTGNVITAHGVGRSTIIEDLTIMGGSATQPESVGAAVYINEASPTLQRCRLVNNSARNGGGVAAYFFSEPLIRDCFIGNNDGGAIVIETNTGSAGTSAAEIYNTVMAHNSGYGVWVLRGARVTMRNCTIAYNNGDGLRAEKEARVTMKKCIVSNNAGGGVVRYDNTVCYALECNDVYRNSAGGYLGSNPFDPCFPGRGAGDVDLSPCYQNAVQDDFHLQPGSQLCLLRETCGVLGAFADPCETGGCCVTAVTHTTWGGVKDLYR